MNLTVNGEARTCPTKLTVRQLLADMDLADAVVAVEVNREVVPRKLHESTTLNDGDKIEVVSLVGGG